MKSPLDADGVWSYIYYSYSVKEKKATAFIRFLSNDPILSAYQTVTFNDVTHPLTRLVRLNIGGTLVGNVAYNRLNLNGIVSRVNLRTEAGAYIGK